MAALHGAQQLFEPFLEFSRSGGSEIWNADGSQIFGGLARLAWDSAYLVEDTFGP